MVRLRDLGLENYLIAATLRGVIAQRLLRRLCPNCRRSRAPEHVDEDRFKAADMVPPRRVCDPVGCEACNNIGYKGRVGVYDIVEIDERLRVAIERGASDTELRALAADRRGSLMQGALQLVADEITDMAELDRTLGGAP